MKTPAGSKVKRFPIRAQRGRLVWTGTPGTPPSFSEARRLFSIYRFEQQRSNDTNGDWIAEADGRLEQLDWIIRKVDTLQRNEERRRRQTLRKRPTPQEVLKHLAKRRKQYDSSSNTEIQLLVEAFYYFASRFCDIVREKLNINGFERLRVADVRHNLIEHPHASNPNFAHGYDLVAGPVIKPFGPRKKTRANKEIHDQGLYVNAAELIERIVAALRREENS